MNLNPTYSPGKKVDSPTSTQTDKNDSTSNCQRVTVPPSSSSPWNSITLQSIKEIQDNVITNSIVFIAVMEKELRIGSKCSPRPWNLDNSTIKCQ
mmetsp:Transcript_64634/g.183403  ORF Transcript_64634/g.183403 Transcript_64634/m.183403 type:complete len:95 (+) Transcript_64634:501-785(+)